MILSMGCQKMSQNITVEDCSQYNYEGCDPFYTEAFVILELTFDDENPYVPIEIYEGDLEDNKLVFADTSYKNLDSISMEFNIDYTVKATYKKDGKTIYAIDQDKAIRWDQNVCDSVCWHYIDAEVDLRLR
jgi:hypothetical protein